MKVAQIFHNIEDNRRLRSQKKADNIKMIILTGSDAIVIMKSDSGGPYAVRAQPKKVNAVIVCCNKVWKNIKLMKIIINASLRSLT